MQHRRRRACKWGLCVVALLLLGAVINVGVAWGLVCWTPPMLTTGSPGTTWPVQVPDEWPPANTFHSAARFGLTYQGAAGDNFAQVQSDRAAKRDALDASARIVGGNLVEMMREYEEMDTQSTRLYSNPLYAATTYMECRIGTLSAGWPLPSVRSVRRWQYEYLMSGWQTVAADSRSSKEGIVIPTWVPWCDHEQTDLRRLPVLINPLGFAVNTAFYAGLLAVIACMYTLVHRRFHIGAGCCTSCGYDLRGAAHTVCPECGTPPARATGNLRVPPVHPA